MSLRVPKKYFPLQLSQKEKETFFEFLGTKSFTEKIIFFSAQKSHIITNVVRNVLESKEQKYFTNGANKNK